MCVSACACASESCDVVLVSPQCCVSACVCACLQICTDTWLECMALPVLSGRNRSAR